MYNNMQYSKLQPAVFVQLRTAANSVSTAHLRRVQDTNT